MNRKLFFLTTALISALAFTPANAGFEWNPPPAKASAPAAQNESISSPADQGGPLTPMPGDMPMGTARVEPVTSAEIMDGAPAVAPVTKTNMPGMKSIGVAGSESDLMLPVPGEMQNASSVPMAADTVEGFGKDIPLATALRQVVPGSYAVAYDSGVDQGKPVSWKGGKAWNNVMSDMLRSKKLHAEMSGNNTIRIVKGTGADLSLPSMNNNMQANMGMDAPMVDDRPAAAKGGRPVIDMSMQKHWTAPAGQSLRQTLQDWSGQANVELAWQDMKDVPIKSAFSYDGTYDQAVDALLSLSGSGKNEPHGKLYPNLPEGPSVLVIGSN